MFGSRAPAEAEELSVLNTAQLSDSLVAGSFR